MNSHPQTQRRRTFIGAAVIVVMVAAVVWMRSKMDDDRTAREKAEQAAAAAASASALSLLPSNDPSRGGVYDGGAIAKTIADRRIRDELRRRILEGWAQGDDDRAAAAKQGRLPAMPTGANGNVDPKYIQSVIREDMFPMAAKCYEELQKRKPKATGRVEMYFKIVGDDKLGGIIEEAEIDGGAAGALGDEKMETCIRESLLSISFRPPPQDGIVTVVYPIVFSPDDEKDD